MKYHFKISKQKKGYWAQCLELPGCLTQADTKKDLVANMEQALNLYLQEPDESTYLAPSPKKNIKPTKNIVEVSVDPKVAVGFVVRCNRLNSGMTQKQAAKKLGMKDLYSYQRLEKKCNPTLALMARIYNVFPKFSVDDILRY